MQRKEDKMNLFKEKPESAIITIPNIITAAGILLLIPYVWGFLTEYRWIMGISLFLSGLSDLLDGPLARKLKQMTNLGKLLDPMRDRLILLAVLINIAIIGGKEIAGWLFLIIATELITVGVNCCGFRTKVHFVGKIRQAIHLLMAGLVILSYYFRDVILSLAGINFNFPVETSLHIMFWSSFLTLCVYTYLRINTDRK